MVVEDEGGVVELDESVVVEDEGGVVELDESVVVEDDGGVVELDESVVVEDDGGVVELDESVVEDWSPLDGGGSVEEGPLLFGGLGVSGCGSAGGFSGCGLSSSSPMSMSSLVLLSVSRAMVNTFAKRELTCR